MIVINTWTLEIIFSKLIKKIKNAVSKDLFSFCVKLELFG
jgi:hypothetical protein